MQFAEAELPPALIKRARAFCPGCGPGRIGPVFLFWNCSPSCGSGEVYDGTFTHTLRSGWGVAARMLAEAGIEVMDEEHLQARLYGL